MTETRIKPRTVASTASLQSRVEASKPHYRWTLKDAVFTKDRGKVFSCFACGGGSTMGYKLAGFDVLGCNEIDPRMARAYVANHHPKYCFLEPIQEFIKRKHFPPELYDLDILDGSPPCSSFSMVGQREGKWGVKKKFREGQQEQVLDTLFFDFIELARKLQPKVVIAENVRGIIQGKAMAYTERILQEFDDAGYACNHYLLDASTMGVPQRRHRVFFVAVRKDLKFQRLGWTNKPNVKLVFNRDPITFGDIRTDDIAENNTGGLLHKYWMHRKPEDRNLGDTTKRLGHRTAFSVMLLKDHEVAPTCVASDVNVLYDVFRQTNREEHCCIGSFPQDYDFAGNPYKYIIGMSVPPLMTYEVAKAVAQQILDLNRDNNRTTLRPAYPPRLLRNRWLQAGKWSYDPNDI